MTLQFLLTLICFASAISVGIDAGKEAGVVGIMIGMGVGLVAGGLAYYALKKTAEYWDKLEGRRKSQPQVVKALTDLVTEGWTILFLLVAAVLMTLFATEFIVQQMAG